MLEDEGHTAEDMLRLFSTPAPKADAAMEASQVEDNGFVYAPARDVRPAICAILTAEMIAAAAA